MAILAPSYLESTRAAYVVGRWSASHVRQAVGLKDSAAREARPITFDRHSNSAAALPVRTAEGRILKRSELQASWATTLQYILLRNYAARKTFH